MERAEESARRSCIWLNVVKHLPMQFFRWIGIKVLQFIRWIGIEVLQFICRIGSLVFKVLQFFSVRFDMR